MQLDLVHDVSKGWMEYVGSYLAYADLYAHAYKYKYSRAYSSEDIPYSSFSGQYSLRDKKSLGYQFYAKATPVITAS